MIFQKSVLALLFSSGASALGALLALPHAASVLRNWDLSSLGPQQLRREQRTVLVSAWMTLLLASQGLSLLLFIFTADGLSSQFTGAMCAVGTLNVNPFGFPALLSQIAGFFLATVWITLNAVDQRSPGYPLTRAKHAFLIAILPILFLTFALELTFFLNLNPSVITSCCGSLFSETQNTVSGDLAGWTAGRAIPAFFTMGVITLLSSAWTGWRGRGAVWLGVVSFPAFGVALGGVISFVSLYVYEHPGHHCPFCLLKSEYGFVGYLLYVPLFTATGTSLGAAALSLLGRRATREAAFLERTVRATRVLGKAAFTGYALFYLTAAWHVVTSGLRLFGSEP